MPLDCFDDARRSSGRPVGRLREHHAFGKRGTGDTASRKRTFAREPIDAGAAKTVCACRPRTRSSINSRAINLVGHVDPDSRLARYVFHRAARPSRFVGSSSRKPRNFMKSIVRFDARHFMNTTGEMSDS